MIDDGLDDTLDQDADLDAEMNNDPEASPEADGDDGQEGKKEAKGQHGGWRPYGGRKLGTKNGQALKPTGKPIKGSRTTKSEAAREKVAEAFDLMGINTSTSNFRGWDAVTVLEFGMQTYLMASEKANDRDSQMRWLQASISVAKELAPYQTAKLSSVDINTRIGTPEQLSDAELLSIARKGSRS